MSHITCPCGFRADMSDDEIDTPGDLMRAYRMHGCERHPAEPQAPESRGWSGAAVSIAFLAAVVVVCYLLLAAKA